MHYYKLQLHRHKGFTLIELLVVIVIIGLLTAIAASSYLNAQRTARDNIRKSNVQSIATAVETYYRAKSKFPGMIGNENGAAPSNPTTWKGCMAYDATHKNIAYYYFPTDTSSTSLGQPTVPCSSSLRGTDTNVATNTTFFDPAKYGAFPNWIPDLGEYLDPVPTENKYVNASGNEAQELDPSGSFSVTDEILGKADASGNAPVRTLIYRKLDRGYMVYTSLENGAGNVSAGSSFSDYPKYPAGGNIVVTPKNVYMIRR